jgi:hypothetical protein
MIGWINILFVVVVVGAVIFLLKPRLRPAPGQERWPLYAKPLLSPPEQVLYARLLRALPDHMVLAQVQLSRFLGVESGRDSRAWLNRINQKSADFVVCRKDTSVVAVIEVDDASHEQAARRAADADKARALGSAGVRLLRWPAWALPDESAIKAAFPHHPPPSAAPVAQWERR